MAFGATTRTPRRPPLVERVDTRRLPADRHAGHRLHRAHRAAEPDLLRRASRDSMLNALKAQQNDVWYYRFDWDEEPAPWNDIYGAAHAFDLPFVFGNFGPSLLANFTDTVANKPGRLDLSAAMMQSAWARSSLQRRPEQRQPRRYLAGLAGDAGLRRDAGGQGDRGAIAPMRDPSFFMVAGAPDAGRAVQSRGRVRRLVLRHRPDADRPRRRQRGRSRPNHRGPDGAGDGEPEDRARRPRGSASSTMLQARIYLTRLRGRSTRA